MRRQPRRLCCARASLYPVRRMYFQPNVDVEVQRYWLSWERKALDWLRDDAPHIIGAVVVACLLTWLFRLLKQRMLAISEREAATAARRSQQLRTMAAVLNGVSSAVIIFITAMTVLKALGIDIAPILASAGIVGLAIGFGAQTLVKDVIN